MTSVKRACLACALVVLLLFAALAQAAAFADVKDALETKDFKIDWTAVAATNAITASAWTAPAGITIVSDAKTATSATIRLSGGTVAREYRVVNSVTLTDGQVRVVSILIKIVEQ